MSEDVPPFVRQTPTPEWVKPHILLPAIGVLILGLIFGSVVVWRAIQRDGRSQAERFGPMDHRPFPPVIGTNFLEEPPPSTTRDEE